MSAIWCRAPMLCMHHGRATITEAFGHFRVAAVVGGSTSRGRPRTAWAKSFGLHGSAVGVHRGWIGAECSDTVDGR